MVDFHVRHLRGQGTLGERLKKIREEHGESIEDIANTLQIQKKYLYALEAGDYLQLPGDVYIRSFLKRYAEYLTVNPLPVFRLYDREQQVFRPQVERKSKLEL